MGKMPLPIKVLVALVVIGVAMVFIVPPQQQLRSCGHPRDLLWEINPFHATHCCSSGRTVSQLVMLYYAQSIYHQGHGTYATSFEQLTNEFSRHSGDSAFYLQSNGSRWSVSVPQQSTLAGSYLLTDDGKLHFNTSGAATTNDVVLRDLSR